MAKKCTTRKRVKDSKWFKDKMLLAQAQEARVVLDEEQQDFLVDSLEETDDCEDLQLQAITNFKADHVDAYDSDCDDEATVPHYDAYHDFDVLNSNIQELGYIENIVSTNESYNELKGNIDVISFTDYMLTIGDDADNCFPLYVQKNDMMLSVTEQIKSQVENYNKENDAPSSSNDTSAIVVPPGYILTTTFVRKVLFPAVCQKVLYGAVCLIVSAVWIDIGLQSIDEGPFKMGNFKETLADGAQDSKQDRVFKDLTPEEKDRHKADVCATNILPQDFHQNKGEAIHEYHVRFTKLINDMRNIKMTMPKMQLNLKFVNNMLPKWGRFVTVVRRNRGLKTSNYDQMYAYLKQHEAHANENKMMLERYTQHDIDPLAF
nr:hypothetical protein [Tanacetum cinerariifolium]